MSDKKTPGSVGAGAADADRAAVSAECPARGLSRRSALVLLAEGVVASALIACDAEKPMLEGACVGAGKGMPVPGAEQIAFGEARLYPAPTDDALFIIAHDEQGFMAIKNYCTHSGCGLTIMPDKTYLCTCHGSKFEFDGKLIMGPAVRPLEHLGMCRRADGVLVVDRTNTLTNLTTRVK